MSVVPLLVLCSLALATFGVLLFVYSVRQHDHEHADRLSLLPLEDDLRPELTVSRDVKEPRRHVVAASRAPSSSLDPPCKPRNNPRGFPDHP